MKSLLILIFLSLTTFSAYAVDESKYDEYIQAAATEYGVDATLIKTIISNESAFRDDIANGSVISSAGAVGVMQLLPSTAADMGFTVEQLKDPEQNIRAGAAYLQWLSKKGYIGNDPILLMAAYNAGPGNVSKYNGVPPFGETIDYVNKGAVKYGEYAGTPPLNTSSVPTIPTTPTIPGGGKGTIPSVPAVNSNMSDILSKFEASAGISAPTLKKVIAGLLVGLALFFAGLQILFFWSQSVTQGGNSFGSLFRALTDSLRTLAVVVILFFFITQ